MCHLPHSSFFWRQTTNSLQACPRDWQMETDRIKRTVSFGGRVERLFDPTLAADGQPLTLVPSEDEGDVRFDALGGFRYKNLLSEPGLREDSLSDPMMAVVGFGSGNLGDVYPFINMDGGGGADDSDLRNVARVMHDMYDSGYGFGNDDAEVVDSSQHYRPVAVRSPVAVAAPTLPAPQDTPASVAKVAAPRGRLRVPPCVVDHTVQMPVLRPRYIAALGAVAQACSNPLPDAGDTEMVQYLRGILYAVLCTLRTNAKKAHLYEMVCGSDTFEETITSEELPAACKAIWELGVQLKAVLQLNEQNRRWELDHLRSLATPLEDPWTTIQRGGVNGVGRQCIDLGCLGQGSQAAREARGFSWVAWKTCSFAAIQSPPSQCEAEMTRVFTSACHRMCTNIQTTVNQLKHVFRCLRGARDAGVPNVVQNICCAKHVISRQNLGVVVHRHPDAQRFTVDMPLSSGFGRAHLHLHGVWNLLIVQMRESMRAVGFMDRWAKREFGRSSSNTPLPVVRCKGGQARHGIEQALLVGTATTAAAAAAPPSRARPKKRKRDDELPVNSAATAAKQILNQSRNGGGGGSFSNRADTFMAELLQDVRTNENIAVPGGGKVKHKPPKPPKIRHKRQSSSRDDVHCGPELSDAVQQITEEARGRGFSTAPIFVEAMPGIVSAAGAVVALEVLTRATMTLMAVTICGTTMRGTFGVMRYFAGVVARAQGPHGLKVWVRRSLTDANSAAVRIYATEVGPVEMTSMLLDRGLNPAQSVIATYTLFMKANDILGRAEAAMHEVAAFVSVLEGSRAQIPRNYFLLLEQTQLQLGGPPQCLDDSAVDAIALASVERPIATAVLGRCPTAVVTDNQLRRHVENELNDYLRLANPLTIASAEFFGVSPIIIHRAADILTPANAERAAAGLVDGVCVRMDLRDAGINVIIETPPNCELRIPEGVAPAQGLPDEHFKLFVPDHNGITYQSAQSKNARNQAPQSGGRGDARNDSKRNAQRKEADIREDKWRVLTERERRTSRAAMHALGVIVTTLLEFFTELRNEALGRGSADADSITPDVEFFQRIMNEMSSTRDCATSTGEDILPQPGPPAATVEQAVSPATTRLGPPPPFETSNSAPIWLPPPPPSSSSSLLAPISSARGLLSPCGAEHLGANRRGNAEGENLVDSMLQSSSSAEVNVFGGGGGRLSLFDRAGSSTAIFLDSDDWGV